jgi:ElaB/YqjD/DUF883 family membrane-anchored ribosome-binding protein
MTWINASARRLRHSSRPREAFMAETERKDTYGNLGIEPGVLKEQYAELLAAIERLEKAVRQRPLLALGIAAAAGFVLGALRRR